MQVKPCQVYKDDLWYPILVKISGYHHIVEMLGRNANAWNRKHGYID